MTAGSSRPARDRVATLLLVALVPLLWIAGHAMPAGAPPGPILQASLLALFTMGAWATGLFVEPVTSLAFFFLAAAFHVAKPTAIFAGFTSSAWWLVLGGSITGIAVESTGLGRRLAAIVFARSTGSYAAVVGAVGAVTVGLAFLMPSTSARVMLLIPIVLALADRVGLVGGRPGRTGLILMVSAGSYLAPTAILPANIPNAVLLGAADTLYGIKLTYGSYLLLHFPVLGLIKTVMLGWLICRLFPDTASLGERPTEAKTTMSAAERRLLAVLGVSLALFATDFWHGLSPAWVALGAGLVCLLPTMGLVTPRLFADRINIGVMIYVAGFLGVGAVIADSGLGERLSHWLLGAVHVVPPEAGGGTLANLAKLALIHVGLGAIATVSGLPAVATPIAGELAAASGLPIYTILMLQVVVFSTVLLPYQCPPIMIGMALGGVRLRDATRLCIASAALTILLLVPLDYLWWQLLGMLP